MYELIPENKYQAFFAVILVLIAAYLLRAGLQYVVCYWGHTFGVLVEADIRRDLFSHLQTLSFGFYDKNPRRRLRRRVRTPIHLIFYCTISENTMQPGEPLKFFEDYGSTAMESAVCNPPAPAGKLIADSKIPHTGPALLRPGRGWRCHWGRNCRPRIR